MIHILQASGGALVIIIASIAYRLTHREKPDR